ncbi:hypothetical protein LS71_006685 [Helicobacter jaachi]|uniref:Uncharacterized protein n=1 Tax=Helicobacter jaachi TaxID=1677920 RepID=A0A4U8T8U4_9HELI|nr:hypothetical protein [Helicobacter jaachi]TLD96160.1 hypothetical protein LS71_006685 [Helicobacter jaachi]
MLLPKTLKILQENKPEAIKDTLSNMLNSDGINVALIDLVFGHYFLYVLLSDGVLTPVFLYEGRISYKQSQASGLPKVHFCLCSEIERDFSLQNRADTLSHRHYLAKITHKNAFSISIRQGLSEVGLYNDYPLELCPMCSDILTHMREGQTIDSTLNVYVFNNQYLHLLESNPTLRQKELTALQVAHLRCCKCKKEITLDSQIWIQIHHNILKIYCC